MSISVGMAVLAAGLGTRMKLDVPKALAPLLGKKLVDFPMKAMSDFAQKCDLDALIGVVTGHKRELLEEYLTTQYASAKEYNLKFAYQEKQLGTADALRCYFEKIPEAKNQEYTLVMCADTPLIRGADLIQLYDLMCANPDVDGIVATFDAHEPKGYGRIIQGEKGLHIVEEKDADEETKQITEVNSGLYIFKTSFVLKHLSKIGNKNKSGEFYLTDLFQDDFEVRSVLFDEESTFLGVNSLEHLEEASLNIRDEKTSILRREGVRFYNSLSVHLDWDVEIGTGSVIYPGVVMEGQVKVGKNCVIEAGVILKNCVIEDGASILAYSYLEDCLVRSNAHIGPFARLRPGADIGEESKVGNFVEVKKAKLHRGVKVSHLSYVGDAEIGKETNIGCGFITCNYDGEKKHKTVIGEHCFIGSDCQAVAPVEIGDRCFVAAGSTITNSIESDAFAIARSKQENKKDLAKRFIKSKKK